MSVDSPALFVSETMPRRRVSSHQAPGPQTVAKMKARQSAKIREIADALISAGFNTLDAAGETFSGCVEALPGPFLRVPIKEAVFRPKSSVAYWQYGSCLRLFERRFLNTSKKKPLDSMVTVQNYGGNL